MKPRPDIGYRLVETIPATLEYGVVYLSQRYQTASHLCICGCRLEVVTPLGLGGWSATMDRNGNISLSPSIGNCSFPCRSHYFIRNGGVLWAGDLTPEMVAAARLADNPRAHQEKPGLWERLKGAMSWFIGLFK